MMGFKLLIIAVRNLRRQLRRTIFTALTFAVAVFIYTVLVAIPVSMDRIADNASKGLRLVVTERNNNRLPAKYCGDIKKMPHVLGCMPEILWGAIYRDPRNVIITYGITSELGTITSSTDYQAPPEINREFEMYRRNAIVGSSLMYEQGWKLREPITLRDPANPKLTLTFIPILELPTEYLSRTFMFNRKLLDEAVKNLFGADIAQNAAFLVVRVDRAENMGLVASRIDENFRNSEAETETETESDSVAGVITSIGNVKTIIYSLCVAILVTMLLIAANSMAMMVRDRTNEVAVMRALGFQRAHIAALLITEAAAIGLVGAALGAGVALWRFGTGTSLGPITGVMGYMTVRPATALAAVVVAVAVSIASAAAPVIRAMRIAPAAAFRKVV
jgi:putative ABC transport system permease protein